MTPNPADNNASLLAAALAPKENWSARSAARQEALQLQGYLTAQKQQEVLEEQQAAAQAEQFLAAVKSIPFMGRDVQRVREHLKGEEKALFTRLRDDYGGDFRQFWAVEGPSWQQGAITRLTQSKLYQQATQNRQNVVTAQAAVQKGENLVGNPAPTASGYMTGEQQLQDFLNGKADTYQFKGSYKLNDDLKSIRSEYASGVEPWIQTQASEDVKLGRLIQQHGQDIGRDMYLRHYQNVPVYYKTDPITDAYKFAMEKGRYGMAVAQDQRETIALQDRLKTSKVDRELKQAHINKIENESLSSDPDKTFDYKLLAEGANQVVTISPDSREGKKLPISEIDLSKVHRLVGSTLFGDLSEGIAQQMGLGAKTNSEFEYDSPVFGTNKTKVDHYGRGNIKEGFIDANGVHPVDLSKSDFVITAWKPVVYIDQRNSVQSYEGKNKDGKLVTIPSQLREGTNGFVNMTIRFKTKADAEKAGVFSDWTVGSVPKGAIGAYNKETRELTLYGNIGPVDQKSNPNLINNLIKRQQGQKAANESYGAPLLHFDTNFIK